MSWIKDIFRKDESVKDVKGNFIGTCRKHGDVYIAPHQWFLRFRTKDGKTICPECLAEFLELHCHTLEKK